MLTTLRRLVLCDWNCVVTFHQRSCLIPYPIDGKVSRHQFLPHHFPGLLRVWGWTTKLLIVQSNYKFTNLFLAIQCVVLSLHTIFFFLKAPEKDWNKVKQSFFSNVIYTKGFKFGDNYSENVTRWDSVARSGSLSKPYLRKTLIYYEARLYCKVDRLRENGQRLKRTTLCGYKVQLLGRDRNK